MGFCFFAVGVGRGGARRCRTAWTCALGWDRVESTDIPREEGLGKAWESGGARFPLPARGQCMFRRPLRACRAFPVHPPDPPLSTGGIGRRPWPTRSLGPALGRTCIQCVVVRRLVTTYAPELGS